MRFLFRKLYALELSTLAERYSLDGMEGCQKFKDLKCQKNAKKWMQQWILFCGRNDFRHKGMSMTTVYTVNVSLLRFKDQPFGESQCL